MKSLKYTFKKGPLMEPVAIIEIDGNYLSSFKAKIEKQLATFLHKIAEDEAEIELTVSPDGKRILYWKVANWNAEGYDKLITLNVI